MEESTYRYDEFEMIVRRIFIVEDITMGGAKDAYIVRYRGHLAGADSAAAYDQLANLLKPFDQTPLFRLEDERQVILLTPGLPQAKPANPRTNLIFFVLTLISVWITGGMYTLGEQTFPTFGQTAWAIFTQGWPYVLALFAILGCHEFGHYLVGRRNGLDVTLPYFIPLPPPFSPFGTMGAMINMRSIPKNRRVLFDVGIAGPLAGLVVAIPVLIYGLSTSPLTTLPAEITAGQGMEGNSILYLLIKYLVFGQLLPAPAAYDVSPVLYWLRYFFTGRPFPFAGLDVTLNAVAWAGWTGLLVTGLNLIPAGTLDGGHIISALFGKKAKKLFPFILGALILLSLATTSWILMGVLIFFLGRYYAEPLDEITQLDPKRKAIGALMILIFFLIFMPVPLSVY